MKTTLIAALVVAAGIFAHVKAERTGVTPEAVSSGDPSRFSMAQKNWPAIYEGEPQEVVGRCTIIKGKTNKDRVYEFTFVRGDGIVETGYMYPLPEGFRYYHGSLGTVIEKRGGMYVPKRVKEEAPFEI